MPPGMIPIATSRHERVEFSRLVVATSMHMSSGKRPEDFTKAVHLTSLFGQDRIPVDARLPGVNGQTAAEEFSYFLRVKPDRRRVKAVYPPHLERRRTTFS